MCAITAATVFVLQVSYIGHTTEWLQYSWIHLRWYSNKDCLYSNFQHMKTEIRGFVILCFQNSWNQVCLQHSCIPIKSFANTPLNRILFFKVELLVLPQQWFSSCLCLCWNNAAVNSRVEALLHSSPESSPVNPYRLIPLIVPQLEDF